MAACDQWELEHTPLGYRTPLPYPPPDYFGHFLDPVLEQTDRRKESHIHHTLSNYRFRARWFIRHSELQLIASVKVVIIW